MCIRDSQRGEERDESVVVERGQHERPEEERRGGKAREDGLNPPALQALSLIHI